MLHRLSRVKSIKILRKCYSCSFYTTLFSKPGNLNSNILEYNMCEGEGMPPIFTRGRNYSNDMPRRQRNWTDKTMEFVRYCREDLQNVDRRRLQLICRSVGINASGKTSRIIENLTDHMDKEGLSEFSFFPFHTDYKSDVNVPGDMSPLSIKLKKEQFCEFDRFYESKFPSVTTVLKATKSEKNAKRLADWRKRELAERGEEGFKKMVKRSLATGCTLHEEVAKWLQEFHEHEMRKAKEFRENFGNFRMKDNRIEAKADFIQAKLYKDGEETDIESQEFKLMESILQVFYEIDNVLAIESGVIHEPLGYAGTIDCIVEFRNKICLIDWKTSKRKKKSWKSCYDYPIQLAAYAAAVNADPAYDFAVNNVAIVFASDDDSPATVLTMSIDECLPFYYEWQGRLQQYKKYTEEIEHIELFDVNG